MLGVVIGRTSRTMVLSNAKFSVHIVLEYGRKGTKFRYYIYTIKSECGEGGGGGRAAARAEIDTWSALVPSTMYGCTKFSTAYPRVPVYIEVRSTVWSY